MNGNGTNGNGNKSQGWRGKTGTKGLQMLAADLFGNVAEIAFLRFQEPFDRAFPALKNGFKAAAYYPIKTIQKPLEFIIDKFAGNIEGEEGREKRRQQTEEQRLDGLLDSTYHYFTAGAVGVATLMIAEKGISRVRKTKEIPGKMWWTVDFPVHVLTAAFLATPQMKPTTTTIKNLSKHIMTTLGWSEQKAEQDSRFFITYILPNYLTLIPTTMMMGGLYHAESHGVIKDMNIKAKPNWMGITHNEHHFERTGKSSEGVGIPVVTNTMLKFSELLQVLSKKGTHKEVVH